MGPPGLTFACWAGVPLHPRTRFGLRLLGGRVSGTAGLWLGLDYCVGCSTGLWKVLPLAPTSEWGSDPASQIHSLHVLCAIPTLCSRLALGTFWPPFCLLVSPSLPTGQNQLPFATHSRNPFSSVYMLLCFCPCFLLPRVVG